ncbi:hypothetical protein GFS24_06285 [Chitinophaga sp. SYP-B3965]|uniref:FimB/Mfa2 family fimbrial subunit n=1 Tax=Chitinophaga sp. SYP-B3965 TaxID=2663120 RepID=UPI001299B395|nr:FimB/Mfa2 family fimbrial subunit [Chitinophaga sp. SYP-B3965]MRG44712.1 hypothetical protein [Chitinophaga sp. SYP-B3965]
MKKLFHSAIALSLFFVSCQKDGSSPSTPPEAEKFPVRFSVTDFDRQVTDLDSRKAGGQDLSNARDSLSNAIQHLRYIAYNSSGILVSTKYQTPADNNVDFGNISDSLPAGTYIIIFVGSSAPAKFFYSASDFGQARLDFKDDNGQLLKIPDTYYKRVIITLGTNGNLPDSSVTLQRIISSIEVHVADAQPADSINITVSHQASRFFFHNDQTSDGYDIRYLSRKDANTYGEYVLFTEIPSTVIITALDRTTGAARIKTVYNVSCYRNKKTILSGNMFSSDASGFKISVNDQWDDNGDPIPF